MVMVTDAANIKSVPRGLFQQVVVFKLDDFKYALALSFVRKIVRSVEITPLPQAPPIVLGAINVRGEIIPVVNVRRRFRLPEREVGLKDHFIIASTSRQKVALVVDTTLGVFDCPEEKTVAAGQICPQLDYVEGVMRAEDGLILIHDLEAFLSLEEDQVLQDALAPI
jgi:purine-binding chemotaxis protein CheW